MRIAQVRSSPRRPPGRGGRNGTHPSRITRHLLGRSRQWAAVVVVVDPQHPEPDQVVVQLIQQTSDPEWEALSPVDNLALWARSTAQPLDVARSITVGTTDPPRTLVLVLGPDEVSVSPSDPVDDPDMVLPAEALVRLVYGWLDPDHTPQVRGTADLDELRRIFPGA